MNMMKRLNLVGMVSIALILALTLGLAVAPVPLMAAQKKYVIGFAQRAQNDPWLVSLAQGFKDAAAKHPEVQLVMTDALNDPVKQASDIEDLIARRVDVIVTSALVARAVTPAVLKAEKAGIPVICIDREIDAEPGKDYHAWIGINTYEAHGQAVGKVIVDYLTKKYGEPKGNIVEIEGTQGASVTRDRGEGMHDVIKKYPGIKIIYRQSGEFNREKAMSLMEDALQAHPSGTIDVVYAHNDNMAFGVMKAIKSAGRAKEIAVIGVDGQKEAIKAVMDGNMLATFICPAYDYGEITIDMALKILRGEKVRAKTWLKAATITKENAKKYYNPKSAF